MGLVKDYRFIIYYIILFISWICEQQGLISDLVAIDFVAQRNSQVHIFDEKGLKLISNYPLLQVQLLENDNIWN